MTSPFTNPSGRAPEAAAAYVKAILARLGDRDPLEVQAELVGALQQLLGKVSPERLARPEAPGKWSALDVVKHLADSELVCSWRLRLVLAEDRPTITGYDQDAWARRLGSAYPFLPDALGVLAATRHANLTLLRSLGPAEWARVGMHVERGPESVALMAKLYAGHDLVHRDQIERILRRE